MKEEYQTEEKLLDICKDYISGGRNKILVNTSKVEQDDRWLNIVNMNKSEFNQLITRLVYKVFILTCQASILIDQDIKKYIDPDDEKYLLSEMDNVDILKYHVKAISLLSTQELNFPSQAIAIWIGYLKKVSDSGDVYPLFGISEYITFPFEGLSKVLHSLEKLDVKKNISTKDREKLYTLLDAYFPSYNRFMLDKDAINYIYYLFGLGKTDFILTNKKWTIILSAEVKRKKLETLFFHFADFPSSKPSKKLIKWKKNLMSIIEDTNIDDLTDCYINTVNDVVKESPEKFPFSSSYNLNVMIGYIYAMKIIDPKNTYCATTKIRSYSCTKIPDIGVCLPQIINICDKVLPKSNWKLLP